MPPTPPAPGCLRARFQWNDGVADFGHHWSFDYVSGGSSPSQTDLNTFAGDLATSFEEEFCPFVNSGFTLNQITVTPLDAADYPVGSWEGSHAGGDSGEAGGSGVTMDIQMQVPLRYRGGHPRSSFPPASVTSLANNRTWNEDVITGMGAAADAFRTAFTEYTTGALTVVGSVCVSYRSGGLERPVGLPLVVTATSLRPRLGSMRLRTKA